MNERDAITLAETLLADFGCDGWRVEIDPRATRRFGQCRYSTKAIGLSRKLVALNDEATVSNTIRHEIAHALAGPNAGHGPLWRAQCAVTGARPERCYNADQVIGVPPAWRFVCEVCGATGTRQRKPSRPMLHTRDSGNLRWERS